MVYQVLLRDIDPRCWSFNVEAVDKKDAVALAKEFAVLQGFAPSDVASVRRVRTKP